MAFLQSCLGAIAIPALAFIVSENRRAVSWWRVFAAFALTAVLAALLLKIPLLRAAFAAANEAVDAIAAATRAGTAFVFGYLGGGPLPFDPKFPGAEFILAFQALPLVLVMSVLTTLLFYWRILPPIVRGFFPRARTHARRRRRGRPLDRRQHLRWHGGGAALYPPLSREAHAGGIVHRHDWRHGRDRRHRACRLRDHSAPAHP
jgi:hypothetical protein